MSLSKVKNLRFNPKDIKTIKTYKPKGVFFIPFVGPILLWIEYARIKNGISPTSKKIINARKLFHLSLFGDILAANILCWILIVADITMLTVTGVVFNWHITLSNSSIVSLWSIIAILHVVYIYFYFAPFVVEWKLLEGLIMMDMIANKKMESGIWMEA